MRRLIIILIGAIAFVSCQKSNQEKAEDLIRKTMDAISQGDSDEEYKNLEFGKLEKAFLGYELTYPAHQLLKQMKYHSDAIKEKKEFIDKWKDIYPAGLKNDIKQMQEHINMIQLFGDSIEHEKARFKPDTTRVMLDVTFQLYNKRTKKHKQESGTFYFDKNITRIVGMLGDENGTLMYIELDSLKNQLIPPKKP
ncbi:MAG: hypothetical protein V8Q76_13210 [Bacteroides intestinalis]